MTSRHQQRLRPPDPGHRPHVPARAAPGRRGRLQPEVGQQAVRGLQLADRNRARLRGSSRSGPSPGGAGWPGCDKRAGQAQVPAGQPQEQRACRRASAGQPAAASEEAPSPSSADGGVPGWQGRQDAEVAQLQPQVADLRAGRHAVQTLDQQDAVQAAGTCAGVDVVARLRETGGPEGDVQVEGPGLAGRGPRTPARPTCAESAAAVCRQVNGCRQVPRGQSPTGRRRGGGRGARAAVSADVSGSSRPQGARASRCPSGCHSRQTPLHDDDGPERSQQDAGEQKVEQHSVHGRASGSGDAAGARPLQGAVRCPASRALHVQR